MNIAGWMGAVGSNGHERMLQRLNELAWGRVTYQRAREEVKLRESP